MKTGPYGGPCVHTSGACVAVVVEVGFVEVVMVVGVGVQPLLWELIRFQPEEKGPQILFWVQQ